MKRFLVFILISFFVLSCNNIDKPKKPDNLISKNKMIDIITDISLVNAAKGVDRKLVEEKGINIENYVYKKYAIDSLQFAKSNNYYAYDVKEYEDIYAQVKLRLEQQKAKFEKLKEKEKKEKDSIRNAKRKKRDSLKSSKPGEKLKEFKPDDLLKREGKLQ